MPAPDSIVQQLSRERGCSADLSRLLLSFTGGDIEGARAILTSVPKDILVVKAKFMAQQSYRYGAFVFFYNLRNKAVERVAVVVSGKPEAAKIDITASWQRVEEKIRLLKSGPGVAPDEMRQVEAELREEEFLSGVVPLCEGDRVPTDEELKPLFRDRFFRVITDPNIAIKMDVARLGPFEFLQRDEEDSGGDAASFQTDAAPAEPTVAAAAQPYENVKEVSLVVLAAEVVLDPIGGIPILDVGSGEPLMVEITDRREIGTYLNRLLGGLAEGQREPVRARAKEIRRMDSGNVSVIVEFGPGIVGRAIVPENVKVEMGFSERPREEADEPFARRGVNPMWIVLLLGGVLAAIVILYFLTK